MCAILNTIWTISTHNSSECQKHPRSTQDGPTPAVQQQRASHRLKHRMYTRVAPPTKKTFFGRIHAEIHTCNHLYLFFVYCPARASFLLPSCLDDQATARHGNGHPRPSAPPFTRGGVALALADGSRPGSLCAPPSQAAPLFLSENLNPSYPAPRLPRSRRDERGPARRETAIFALCAPNSPTHGEIRGRHAAGRRAREATLIQVTPHTTTTT